MYCTTAWCRKDSTTYASNRLFSSVARHADSVHRFSSIQINHIPVQGRAQGSAAGLRPTTFRKPQKNRVFWPVTKRGLG